MQDDRADRSAIEAAAQLADPTRRKLYDLVAASPRPLARDEAAAAAGVSTSLAAFHLDRLVAAGLLEAEYRRRGSRRGPGAGRPAKLYRRAATTIDFSLPARRYGLAATLLAEAVAASGPRALDALRQAARAWGREVAVSLGRADDGSGAAEPGDAGGDPLLGVLAACGFEPLAEPGGVVISLRNCPFAEMARERRDVACPMNLAIVEGLAEGLGGCVAVPDATAGHCCVAVRRTRDASSAAELGDLPPTPAA